MDSTEKLKMDAQELKEICKKIEKRFDNITHPIRTLINKVTEKQ